MESLSSESKYLQPWRKIFVTFTIDLAEWIFYSYKLISFEMAIYWKKKNQKKTEFKEGQLSWSWKRLDGCLVLILKFLVKSDI